MKSSYAATEVCIRLMIILLKVCIFGCLIVPPALVCFNLKLHVQFLSSLQIYFLVAVRCCHVSRGAQPGPSIRGRWLTLSDSSNPFLLDRQLPSQFPALHHDHDAVSGARCGRHHIITGHSESPPLSLSLSLSLSHRPHVWHHHKTPAASLGTVTGPGVSCDSWTMSRNNLGNGNYFYPRKLNPQITYFCKNVLYKVNPAMMRQI